MLQQSSFCKAASAMKLQNMEQSWIPVNAAAELKELQKFELPGKNLCILH